MVAVFSAHTKIWTPIQQKAKILNGIFAFFEVVKNMRTPTLGVGCKKFGEPTGKT
jgi:hypothetical protein